METVIVQAFHQEVIELARKKRIIRLCERENKLKNQTKNDKISSDICSYQPAYSLHSAFAEPA